MAVDCFLGYPPENIKKWIEDHIGSTGTKFVYATTNGGAHTHQFEVTELTGDFSGEEWANIGIQTCKVENETINNRDIISLSSDEGCTCTSIGDAAFWGCAENLKSIYLPTITSIGEMGFYNCTDLTSAYLPNVTNIGACAFCYCGFSTLSLPKVTTVGGESTFEINTLTSIELNSIKMADVQKSWFSRNNTITVICSDGTKTIQPI